MIKVEIDKTKPTNKYYLEKLEQSNKDYMWSKNQLEYIKNILKKYPEGKEKSAVLDVLIYAQKQFEGWLPLNLMKLVAKTLQMPLIKVEEIVSFYDMLNSNPVGKYQLFVCSGCSCQINKSLDIIKTLKEEIGEFEDGISKDGLFTITQTGCLGACINGPVILLDNKYHEKMTPQKAKELVKALKTLAI